MNLTRDLVNEPSNILTPHEYTKRIGDLAGPDLRLKFLIRKMDQLSMGALWLLRKEAEMSHPLFLNISQTKVKSHWCTW